MKNAIDFHQNLKPFINFITLHATIEVYMKPLHSLKSAQLKLLTLTVVVKNLIDSNLRQWEYWINFISAIFHNALKAAEVLL
jgi:hypothetical protein